MVTLWIEPNAKSQVDGFLVRGAAIMVDATDRAATVDEVVAVARSAPNAAAYGSVCEFVRASDPGNWIVMLTEMQDADDLTRWERALVWEEHVGDLATEGDVPFGIMEWEAADDESDHESVEFAIVQLRPRPDPSPGASSDQAEALVRALRGLGAAETEIKRIIRQEQSPLADALLKALLVEVSRLADELSELVQPGRAPRPGWRECLRSGFGTLGRSADQLRTVDAGIRVGDLLDGALRDYLAEFPEVW